VLILVFEKIKVNEGFFMPFACVTDVATAHNSESAKLWKHALC